MNVVPAQFQLDLSYRPAMERDDFLVSPSNAAAVAWIDRWPDWPVRALMLVGPPACGKSHLASVWRRKSNAVDVEGSALTPPEVLRLLDLGGNFVVESAEQADENALLHLFNATLERRGNLLLVADEPPSRWKIALPDLTSRLRALPVAAIGAPDDALFCAVLTKLFADRQLVLPADMASFLLVRLERSFAMARRIVAALDAASLAERRPLTIPLAREVLNRMAVDGSLS